ncbi:MAG: hypothetical protein M3Y07_06195 [Acidobacteriota bacterium]|nr:hypothetical protein [Acidobacteriota bacterium]
MKIGRREFLTGGALAPLAFGAGGRKKVAIIATIYRPGSHSDVIAGRLLGGYEYNGEKRKPLVDVVSMYIDQFPKDDMSRGMSAKYHFPISPTVRGALTLGGKSLAVDGVVLIGEHGDYPDNEKGQKMYPRYELFKQIVDVFRESGRAAPVFNDKHLSYDWQKAKWMYDQSRELKFPLMAGSSVPLAWRRPPFELDLGAPVERAVAIGYSGMEIYGFHTLEALQCMVERRKGGETGIAAVQCLKDDAAWKWLDANAWAKKLMDAGLRRVEKPQPGLLKDNVKHPIVFALDYTSGLKAAVVMLTGQVTDFAFAADLAGRTEPVGTEIWLQPVRYFSHFAGLVYYIEQMIVTGKEQYPVERTLLTTGALAALFDSSYQNGKRIETPQLAIRYRAPEKSLYNRGPVPSPE